MLQDLERSVPGLATLSHSEKVKLFAWYLHQNGKDRVDPASLRACFTGLHLEPPSNISQLLTNLSTKKAKEMLKDRRGHFLEGKVRSAYDAKYGDHEITVAVRQLLTDLPGKIPDEAEKRFLTEALTCFKHGAFRSAIVMTWNLAFFHLSEHIFNHHLPAFNAALKAKTAGFQNPDKPRKVKEIVIVKRSDMSDLLKEFDTIELARSAGIIEAGVKKVLNQKLEIRNTYAHPSQMEVSQLTAEEFITDLVNNVVLKVT